MEKTEIYAGFLVKVAATGGVHGISVWTELQIADRDLDWSSAAVATITPIYETKLEQISMDPELAVQEALVRVKLDIDRWNRRGGMATSNRG